MARGAKRQGVRQYISAEMIARHLLVLVIVVAILYGIWRLVDLAIEESNGEGKWNIILQIVLQTALVGGFGGIIAISQFRQNKAIAKRQAKQTQTIAKRQEEQNNIIANRQEQQAKTIADRQSYTTAIEHLSSNSPAVRLKGIRDLCKHNATDEQAAEIHNLFNDQVKFFTRNKDYQESNPTEPAKDIQALLDILSDRIEESKRDFQYTLIPNQRIDWSGAFLKGASLWDVKLQGARLWNINLQGASLWGAKLQGTDLWDANLQGASLQRTKLQGANLQDTKLQGADLEAVNLQGADLEDTKFQGADLEDVNLQGAILRDTKLQGAILQRTKLQGASLQDINLQGASLWNINLQGANLHNANLHETALEKVDLRGVTSGTKYLGMRPFEERIRRSINQPADVTGILLGENITSKEAKEKYLKAHGVILGTYTKEEAEQWIAEYNATRQKDDPQQ